MDRTQIRDKVTQIVRSIARIEIQGVESASHLHTDFGIDSLDLLVVRESIERTFDIFVADEEASYLHTVSGITDLVETKLSGNGEMMAAIPETAPIRHTFGGRHLSSDNAFYADVEIGMHLTGRNNLAETPLLREIGQLRWEHLSAIVGVPSKDIIDEAAERLYPTFFFVDMAFPNSRPMAMYGENDRLTIVSTLRRFGVSFLDGEHFLFPAHWPADRKTAFATREQALRSEVPVIRMSNSFVKQWRGAEWLKRSRPVNPGFTRIPEMTEPPDSYAAVMQAKDELTFFKPAKEHIPITDSTLQSEYQIVPDRDLNGAGLLYFANYPIFLDIAERTLLRQTGALALEDDILDRRTLIHRRSAYLSNATSDDKLSMKVRAWIENPFTAQHPDPAAAPIRLLLNYEMYRASDERLMMISSARKIVFGRTFGDTKLLEPLRDIAHRRK